MPIETDCLLQNLVLWTINDVDDYGEYVFDLPVDISARFQRGKFDSVNSLSANEGFRSRAAVDQNIAVGSLLWEGTVAAINSGTTPTDVHQVVRSRRLTDIRGVNTRRVLDMMKYRRTIPLVVTSTVAYGFRDGTTAYGFRDGTTAIGYNS